MQNNIFLQCVMAHIKGNPSSLSRLVPDREEGLTRFTQDVFPYIYNTILVASYKHFAPADNINRTWQPLQV